MLTRFVPSIGASWFDLLVVVGLFLGGAAFHWDFGHWANGLVGGESSGDAHFWWDGAVRVSEGMFRGHPGKGFRPGYFVFTGLSLPATGPSTSAFHKFLLLNFLATAAFLYLALRQPLGRAAAAAGTATLVFNPFTAEWVATSTTDGLGLALHIASLACLLVAVQRDLGRGWVAGFGVLFALATLTRPIVTPFIGVAALLLLLLPARSWRQRLVAAAVSLVAFALPTVLWLGVQRAWVGEWSISTNDASALYAASHPEIQVWQPSMYAAVEARLRARSGAERVTEAQLNEEFRRQTFNNYRRHYAYHLRRAVPHLWEIASVSPTLARHPTPLFQAGILSVLAAAVVVGLLARGYHLRGLVLAAAGASVWLSPHAVGFFTLAGGCLALLIRPGRSRDLGLVVLCCYWLVGVLALFLTGGTWSSPHTGSVVINSLGARVGSQIFFVGDLLACVCLVRMASLELPPEEATATLPTGLFAFCRGCVGRFLTAPSGLAASATAVALGVVVVGDVATLGYGAATIARRTYALNSTPQQPFPDLAPVLAWYQEKSHPEGVRDLHLPTTPFGPDSLFPPGLAGKAEGVDRVVTGTTGFTVWNMTGQSRAQIRLLAQHDVTPNRLTSDFQDVELPFATTSSEWGRRQGAFIVRGAADRHRGHNLPYYLSAPAVRAFVPLTPDGSGYALDQAVWFPLTRYAAQLDAAGMLACSAGSLTWAPDSGSVPFQRRACLSPAGGSAEEPRASLVLRLRRALGRRTLRFAYLVEGRPAAGEPELHVRAVEAESPGGEQLELRTIPAEHGLTAVEVDCSASGVSSVEVSFRNLPPGGVWLYEFNLTADDFRP